MKEIGPVFVVGCDRSGTTLLRLMLSATPELHIPAETGFLPEFGVRAKRYGRFDTETLRRRFLRDLTQHAATSKTRSFDAFELDPADALRCLEQVAPTDYAGAVTALFSATAASYDKPRWGDKTPRNVLRIPWLAKAFPDGVFLHVVRDPRAVAASLRAAGWIRVPRRGARFWRERVGRGRSDGALLGAERYMEVKYEDLLANTEECLHRICRFARLTLVPDMLAFHRVSMRRVPAAHHDLFARLAEPLDSSRAEAWKRELSPRQVRHVEGVASPLMEELGYNKTSRGMSVPEAIALSLLDSVHGHAAHLKRRM